MSTPTQTVFNELIVRCAHGQEWCRLLWERLPDSATFDGTRWQTIFVTSFGTWSHTWHIGGESLPRFLADLNSDYLASKLIGEYTQFSPSETVKAVQQQIIDYRRTDSMDKDAARGLWDEIAGLEACGELNIHTFGEIYWGDFDVWPDLAMREPSPFWQGFWDRLWTPAVVPALQAIDEEVAAA